MSRLGGDMHGCRFTPFHPENLVGFLKKISSHEVTYTEDLDSNCFCYTLTENVELFLYWVEFQGKKLILVFKENKETEEFNSIIREAGKFFLSSPESPFWEFELKQVLMQKPETVIFLVEEKEFIEFAQSYNN
ncbi:MAG: hypothetical protein WCQ96_02680 [Patescibacteria group bacterium]